MKKMINNNGKNSVAGIWGRLYEVDTNPENIHALKFRETGPNSKNPGTKYIGGDIKIATDEACTNIITITYPYVVEFFASKNGNPPKENGTYKFLKKVIDGEVKTVMNSSKEEAVMIKASPNVALNEFYTEDRETHESILVSTKINSGGFISVIDQLPENENSRAMFDVDFFIKGTRTIEADEEADRPEKLILSGAIFNYNGELLPIEFSVVDKAAINYFENCEINNNNPLFTRIKGKQISNIVKVKKEEEGAFGEPIVREFTNTRKDWIITWAAAEPYEFPSDDLSIEELQKAMQDRELYLAELKQRYENKQATKQNNTSNFNVTAQVAPGGFNF